MKAVFFAALLIPATVSPALTITGVLETGDNEVYVDTVKFWAGLVPTPVVFSGLDWGGPAHVTDTAEFTPLARWPSRAAIYGRVDAVPDSFELQGVIEERRYPWPDHDSTTVMFTSRGGVVEGERPAARPCFELSVTPGVLTDFVTISAVSPGPARLEVYDGLGNCVRTFPAGAAPDLRWNGDDESGNRLAEGVYFCQLVSGSRSTVRKVLIAAE